MKDNLYFFCKIKLTKSSNSILVSKTESVKSGERLNVPQLNKHTNSRHITSFMTKMLLSRSPLNSYCLRTVNDIRNGFVL
jgi:hypothetical protein